MTGVNIKGNKKERAESEGAEPITEEEGTENEEAMDKVEEPEQNKSTNEY